jgi:flagellar biosynthesis protein FlhG
VLVTGGKGGVGKSTVAANLAVELARGGVRTLLCDLDFGLANQHLLLGLQPDVTLEDFLLRGVPLERCLACGPRQLAVLPGASGTARLGRLDDAARDRLAAELTCLSERFDVVVGDSAAGIGPDVLSFAARADRVLVVTTPDPVAMTDAYGLLKALDAHAREHKLETPTPELFLNLVQGGDEARTVARHLRSISERFLLRSPRLAGWLPRARIVAESIAARRPFVLADPRSAPARAMRELAERFARPVPAAVPPRGQLKPSECHAR